MSEATVLHDTLPPSDDDPTIPLERKDFEKAQRERYKRSLTPYPAVPAPPKVPQIVREMRKSSSKMRAAIAHYLR